MAITHVQTSTVSITGSSSSAQTITFPSVAAGDTIVVFVSLQNATARTVTVTNSIDPTATQAGSYATNSTARAGIFYFPNTLGSVSTMTITVTPSGSTSMAISAVDYSGVATSSPLDHTQTNTGTSSTALSTGSVTATSGDLVVGVVSSTASMGGTFTTPNRAMATAPSSGTCPIVCLDDILLASGALTGTVSTAGTWAAAGASFLAAASGGGSGAVLPRVFTGM